MGSACCVAARDKTLPNRTSSQHSTRNIRYSPSWSFRWDARTHVEDSMDNQVPFPRGNSQHAGFEIKGGLETETEALSDEGSPVENFQTPTWQKSLICKGTTGTSRNGAPDLPMGHRLPPEERDSAKPSAVSNTSSPKLSVSLPPTASSSMSKVDPSSSQTYSLPADQTPSRQAALSSPSYHLSRQASDSQILAPKSPNDNSLSERRQSFALPASSNDSALGSHGGSSDGWSMHMFSELVASSQRERWSFDSENTSYGHHKTSRSNSPMLTSPSMDFQTCGICSKLLTERLSWSCNEIAVVAVLVCGHVYHAECLEKTTTEKDRYDPSCPICTVGEKPALKMYRKALRAEADWKARNKLSRIGVADVDLEGDMMSDHRKSARREGKGPPKMGASSSMKSSFGRPFLRRHFSIGSRSTRVPSEVESTRRKGFWARYRRE
ncbi:uncharacterized protein LOC131237916 [Magnolia sinica]|uniref:uncharacterized protein LOC131237916 n=1 Tax=Magnolia sinica TaxID=86752 RepID=UPI00265985C7|nr:uncharacterized protein LOC131237916 [Magnolia sinica]XP_058091963.1 uncharacterized protein LOC131237916 [Magnolia sinica]XP_058091964.1 uncharacterized protein LOC131237916 [Magnolia sinica]